MQVRVRLGAGLSRLSTAPALTLELEDGATVDDLLARLRNSEPDLAPALRSALLVIGGVYAERRQLLQDRQEIALLLPASGG
jgi:molybdopterin converting factor small subunit